MSLQVALLPGGRLHLQHGPIDLICQAWGTPDAVQSAYAAAASVFPTILPALCSERGQLRQPSPQPRPHGAIAKAMHAACAPYAAGFITPMAAVAGAVADHVLAAMSRAGALDRAFVNNGGDIAFHLAPNQTLRCGLATDLAAPGLDGVFALTHAQPSRGIATSGRACKGHGGRSFSFGIADTVTVLARTAAQADAAATVIANAVDLPGHASVQRRPANEIDPDSDLGPRQVTWDVGALQTNEVAAALLHGQHVAARLVHTGLIDAAVLTLRHQVVTAGLRTPIATMLEAA